MAYKSKRQQRSGLSAPASPLQTKLQHSSRQRPSSHPLYFIIIFHVKASRANCTARTLIPCKRHPRSRKAKAASSLARCSVPRPRPCRHVHYQAITLLINRRIGPDCDSVFFHAMDHGSFGRSQECVRGWSAVEVRGLLTLGPVLISSISISKLKETSPSTRARSHNIRRK